MAYLLSMGLDLVKFFKLHAQRILWILLLLLVLVFFFHRWYAGSSVVVFEVKAWLHLGCKKYWSMSLTFWQDAQNCNR